MTLFVPGTNKKEPIIKDVNGFYEHKLVKKS